MFREGKIIAPDEGEPGPKVHKFGLRILIWCPVPVMLLTGNEEMFGIKFQLAEQLCMGSKAQQPRHYCAQHVASTPGIILDSVRTVAAQSEGIVRVEDQRGLVVNSAIDEK